MFRFGSSELLILSSTIFSFTNLTISIVCLSLGVLGALGRFGSEHAEKQAKLMASEEGGEKLASIVTNFVENMNKSKDSFH